MLLDYDEVGRLCAADTVHHIKSMLYHITLTTYVINHHCSHLFDVEHLTHTIEY